jgi:hypothetical protein
MFFVALSLALLTLEGLLLYDLYPLLPIGFLAAGAFVAAIPQFLALAAGNARGRLDKPARR